MKWVLFVLLYIQEVDIFDFCCVMIGAIVGSIVMLVCYFLFSHSCLYLTFKVPIPNEAWKFRQIFIFAILFGTLKMFSMPKEEVSGEVGFCMLVNINFFYKLILSFSMDLARHAQST